MLKITNRILLAILPLTYLIGFWQWYVHLAPQHSFYLGSPSGIVSELIISISSGEFIHDFAVTVIEAFSGFLSGTVIGTIVGLSLWFSKTGYNLARPYLIVLGTLPVFALGPILIFWFGTGMLSKIVIGFLSTFAIALGQAYNGAMQTDNNLLTLIQAFGGTRVQAFKKVVVPSSIIWVLAGIRINISTALLGAFIGEFISSQAGLGHSIILNEGLFNVNGIWVGIIGLLMIALLFNLITSPIVVWAKRWKN